MSMYYPSATPAQIAFFNAHGFVLVSGAIAPAELDVLEAHCDRVKVSQRASDAATPAASASGASA